MENNKRKRPTHNRFYDVHRKMISRCYDENSTAYENYGAIGVTVCDRWRLGEGVKSGLDCFTEDMSESFQEGLSLNRKGGSLIYSPETVEWADSSLQNYERRTSSKNSTGRTGVYRGKRRLKSGKTVVYFRAYIKTKDMEKQLDLGCYDNFQDAVKAREHAEIKYYGKIRSDLLEDYYKVED